MGNSVGEPAWRAGRPLRVVRHQWHYERCGGATAEKAEPLGQHYVGPCVRGADGSAEPRGAATDNEDVRFRDDRCLSRRQRD